MTLAKKTKTFFSYWYTRYLMVTEMYMVEPWERAIIHIIFAVVFGLFWLFNSTLVINGLSRLRSTSPMVKELVN